MKDGKPTLWHIPISHYSEKVRWALGYPLVLPPEGPQLPDPPEALERFRAPLKERPGYRWVEEMFHRHRRSPDT